MSELKSKQAFLSQFSSMKKQGVLQKSHLENLERFFQEYAKETQSVLKEEVLYDLFYTFLCLVEKEVLSPYNFPLYHERIKTPFNYTDFGKNFILPLIDLDRSPLLGKNLLLSIEQQLKNQENVIFFANHQTEVDPQIISLLFEKEGSFLGDDIIYVAGERVVKDPKAIPFSLGCNLFCIYSKKYIEHPQDQKKHKQQHNKKTMYTIGSFLQEGGKVIYVAPSGGRDRKTPSGDIPVSCFDERSIEIFHLLAKKSKTPTHFYPLALFTYELMPPPCGLHDQGFNEERRAKRTKVGASIGEELVLSSIHSQKNLTKEKERAAKKAMVYNGVKTCYQTLLKNL